MRRCPRCQAPNPEASDLCRACGAALPRARRSLAAWTSALRGPDPGRAALAVLPPLLFQISAGRLLGVGQRRQEWHFLAFHACHGLLLGASMAWLWAEAEASEWCVWLGAGLAGGLLAEALELWFSYRHWMGELSLRLWVALGLPENPALVYQLLQVLRYAAPILCLGMVRLRKGDRVLAWPRLLAGGLLALALRSQVRGAWVAWNAFAVVLGWEHALLSALSLLALAWALGPEGLTAPGKLS